MTTEPNTAVRPGAQAPGRRAFTLSLTGSLRGRLTLLVTVLVVAASIAAALLVVDAARGHRATTERQLYGTARALSLATDGEVGRLEAVLGVLAASPDLQNGDLAAFERQVRALDLPVGTWIVLLDANGIQRVNSRVAAGTPLPPAAGPNFAARWRTLIVDGRKISDLADGRLYNGKLVAVDILVRRDGKPAYDLMALTKPGIFQAVIDKQALPPGWYGGLIDRRGVLIARNVDPVHTVGHKATADMITRINRSPAGVFESMSLDGSKTLVAYNRSDLTGWSTSVAMPRSEGVGLADRALVLTLAAAGALLMAGAAVAFLLARGATNAMERLGLAAEALGQGRSVVFRPAGISEIDAVAEALSRAADDLRARETDLRELNETLEARVKEATETLVQAQKLEAMGRLTGGVAHDFNNLLTAILGNLDLLGKRLTDEKLRRYVVNAGEAAQKGARLTAQLLAFARKQRLDPEPVDVNGLVEGMIDLLSGAVGGQVRIETALSPDTDAALADRTQLELIILNLAINARDAMPSGGVLRIETGLRTVVTASGGAEGPHPGDYVMIAVADTGEGMSEEVLARVFEPFFTTKAVGHGSGLGLPQILGVAKQLGGGVDIETQPGVGSTVRVFLPPATGEAAPADDDDAPDLAALAGLTVLVVDDDEPVRIVAAGLLAELGLVPITAGSAAEAIATLEAGVRIDLALLDYAMPDLNGAETAARLRALMPDLPVVLMSGYADGEALAALWSGPLLAKPFTAEALAAELSRVMAG